MSFEAYTFFEIILAGFVAVWTFRHYSKPQAKLSDFEYLGWSAFWGLAIITSFQLVAKLTGMNSQNLNYLFGNPFATGFLMSILGMTGGFIAAKVFRDLKNK